MADSYFFYDLETSGLSPSDDRVMQFAGQRTDANLVPIGEPINVLIKLSADILPSPDAIVITGITPQQTITEGLTEVEFLNYFHETVAQPNTIYLGFNTIRFDDEFMRYLFYRNFYDPYEWQWLNKCSRWDILDLVRMTRALRPDGIEWPVTSEGKATNRLELLTKLNGLEHSRAHDALSDVYATISIAKLISDKQPALFKYLLDNRTKQSVLALLNAAQPFVYSSGRYPSDTLNTTVAAILSEHPQAGSYIIFDLRFDPEAVAEMTVEEIVTAWRYDPDMKPARKPIKTLKTNRCPAIAPFNVINSDVVAARLQLDLKEVDKNYQKLQQVKDVLTGKVLAAQKILDEERAKDYQSRKVSVDAQLYEGFFNHSDKNALRLLRECAPDEINGYVNRVQDERLKQLIPLYKARNYPSRLTSDERAAWDQYCHEKLFAGGTSSLLAAYFSRIQHLAVTAPADSNTAYLLEELRLYGESVMPSDEAA